MQVESEKKPNLAEQKLAESNYINLLISELGLNFHEGVVVQMILQRKGVSKQKRQENYKTARTHINNLIVAE